MCLKNILNKSHSYKCVSRFFGPQQSYRLPYTVIHSSCLHPKTFWTKSNLLKKYSWCNYLTHRTFNITSCVLKKRKTREEKQFKNIIQFKPKTKRPTIELWGGITPTEFAKQANRSLGAVFEALSLIENGDKYRSPNVEIDNQVLLRELAKTLGYRIQKVGNPKYANGKNDSEEEKDIQRRPKPEPKSLVKKPPVVTIMGHVDHGKTTLLDSLRNTSVVAQEFGGITQHIGAFSVKTSKGNITFLDTPGHAAFQAMRARGAHATDIVVLVVAADDGIMEQTLESIRFAREAKVPIIVAINKIDKPNSDPDEVKRSLLTCGIQLEELGGEVQSVSISALKKLHLDDLIETIITQAEIMEISSDPTGSVEGVVLETSVAKGKGKISTALVQMGTLQKGDFLVAGTAWAKVKALLDDQGKNVSEATPGTPVQVVGWKILPIAGDIIQEAESEKHAQDVIRYREFLKKEKIAIKDSIAIQKQLQEHLEKYRAERQTRLLSGHFTKRRAKEARKAEISFDLTPFFAIVLKGDVHGSIEAIIDVLSTYNYHDDCRLDLIHYAVGDVTDNDLFLAESYEGLIYCFNVNVPSNLEMLAEEKNITIKHFNVIYHLIDDMKNELNLRLPTIKEEEILGEANVLQEFIIKDGKKKIHTAGCKCMKGIIKRNSFCRIIRFKDVLYEGLISSLKHEKADVETIKKDVECGLQIEDTDFAFLPGDTIICYEDKYVPQITKWEPGF